jgi:1-acyl-sn-glycerol-3-phosphate acyltransferase
MTKGIGWKKNSTNTWGECFWLAYPMWTNFLMWNWMITLLVYIVFKIRIENKQYVISFELVISSQNKL